MAVPAGAELWAAIVAPVMAYAIEHVLKTHTFRHLAVLELVDTVGMWAVSVTVCVFLQSVTHSLGTVRVACAQTRIQQRPQGQRARGNQRRGMQRCMGSR